MTQCHVVHVLALAVEKANPVALCGSLGSTEQRHAVTSQGARAATTKRHLHTDIRAGASSVPMYAMLYIEK